ncbi:uncharacterized protein BJ171DRAFT_454265 [Polychytrium aggregatum]|uniref:uncharacterized protein n=1 Tax=Polychytrium aggregatum TaxID=110093 RepID=UPI0022FEC720|nr:uncharacterized protein BJ171DRAFT_454265 [Polychytrium aggregatum]KAI9209298.1 hypothetical protein BJ171DRAFT_454265 [Polychytrium aggregatum]
MPRDAEKARAALGSSVGVDLDWSSFRTIASLWGQYGFCARIRDRARQQSFVLKHISPPAPSTGSVSHERKLKSYLNELRFYRLYAKTITAETGLALPEPYFLSSTESLKSSGTFEATLLLSDLSESFPLRAPPHLPLDYALAGLRWLAQFHAFFWESDSESQGELAPIGSYWYLTTRWAEFEEIDTDEWPHFSREFAERLHNRLLGFPRGDLSLRKSYMEKGRSPSYQASAYDFQYTGYGYGAVDIAYLMTSSVSLATLQGQGESQLLDFYHDQLTHLLGHRCRGYDRSVLQLHYELALVDYVRFMAGWGLWGNSSWARHRVDEIMGIWSCDGGVRNDRNILHVLGGCTRAASRRFTVVAAVAGSGR